MARPSRATVRRCAPVERLEQRLCLSTTDPVIFHITDTAVAGQVISVQGENFGSNPQIWLDRIVDSADAPNAETQVTNVLVKNSQMVTAELPAGLAEGLYAVMIKNTDTGVVGAPQFINRARGLQFLDLADKEIYAGQAFRIAGHNLNFTATATTVQFREKANPANVLNATFPPSQPNDPFILSVIAPTGLVDGVEYEVLVNNGYGGSYGQTVVAKTLTGTTGGVDHWGLGTSWAPDRLKFYNNVINVADFGAIANDGIDDRTAIQAAINAAAASVVGGIQGGVVQFAAGTYDVNGGSIAMKSRVVLQGAGRTLTKLESNTGLGTAPMFTGTSLFNLGVVDMAVESTVNGTNSTWKVGGEGHFFQRARFVNSRKEVIVYGATYMLLDDVEIVHTPLNGTAAIYFVDKNYFIIRDSNIQWSDGSIQMYDTGENGTSIQLENNTWSRSTASDGSGSGYRGISVGGQSEVAIINNTFNRLQTSGNIPQNNDGETMLNENVDFDSFGQVAAGTTGTTFNTVPTFSANKVGLTVTIVRGKGMGQTRNIIAGTGNSFTLDSAWDVDPDTTSYFTINSYDRSYLVKGNTLEDVPRGIWLNYASTMDDVAIVGNTLLDGQSIYLRGDQRNANRFNVQSNILVEDNYLENNRNWVPAQIVVTAGRDDTVSPLLGNPFYNVLVRKNTIALTGAALVAGGFGTDVGTAVTGDGYFFAGAGVVDNNTPALIGVVADHNRSINLPTAYRVNTGSKDVVIFNSVNENVGQVLSDATMTNGTHASEGTVLAWTTAVTTPPFVTIEATAATATEGGADGNFRISRTGTSGNLVVNYTVSGTAAGSDYTQTFTGTATITSGNSFVDLPVTANNELVYFEPNETLRLTITPSVNYQVANPWSEVTIIDNDKTNKVLDVSFSGTGGGTGGAGDLVSAGATGSVNEPPGANSVTIGNANPMGAGNYANLSISTLGDTAPSVRVTPLSAESSLAAMTQKVNGQWQLNGGFDFFVRRNSGGVVRMLDVANSGGWKIVSTISGSAISLTIDTPAGTDFSQSVSTTFSAGQIYHVGVTFSTDPATGLATIKFYKKAGTGAINTSSTADQVGTLAGYTWNPDDTATKGFTSGAFNFGSVAAFWATANIDFDSLRVYNATPGVFSDITGDSVVTVAATDASATETPGNAGTFTVTRSSNNTLTDLTVYYTLTGTAGAGDYSVSPTVGSVTILAGQTSATVTITPIDDLAVESTENVVMNLLPDANYVVGSTGASISIADNDSAALPAIIINEVINGAATASGNFDGGEAIELLLTQDLTAAQLQSYYFGDSTTDTIGKYHASRLQNLSGIASTFKAGTIIVIGSTLITQDTSYDPANGDWNIFLRTTPPAGQTDYVLQNGNNFALGSTGDVVWVGTSTGGTATIHSVAWETSGAGSFYNAAHVKLGTSYNGGSGLPTGSLSFTGGAGDLLDPSKYEDANDGVIATLGQANGGDNTALVTLLRQ